MGPAAILPLNLKEEENLNGTEITRGYQDQLAQQILEQPGPQPNYSPLPISRPLAKALLQKAIRRGEEQLAQRAAATLLAIAPDGFWRRAVIIAAEDIGVADVEVVGLVTAAARAGKRWRAQLGGEHVVGHFIVSLMVASDRRRCT